MKRMVLINIVIGLFVSCTNNLDYKLKYPCVFDFWYYKHEAFVTKGLVSVILTEDRGLRNTLLSPIANSLKYKYYGGIYNIDSLYFPPPTDNIIRINDSIIIFGQHVYGLEQYPEPFIDSIVDVTKKELVIEITDTLNGKKWVIPYCKDIQIGKQ